MLPSAAVYPMARNWITVCTASTIPMNAPVIIITGMLRVPTE